jgi:dTDP-4-dehydrorhamnose reductase
MRVLVIGSDGQLGRALSKVFSRSHEVVETVHRNPRPDQLTLDLADVPSMRAVLQNIKPDAILIAGAFCHVDLCETEREACWRVNAGGTEAVADYAREGACHIVYYSTDQVFDGTRETFQETDPTNPLNVYAQSKAAGETVLRELLPERHLILRTAWLYGPDRARKNFALRLAQRVGEGSDVTVPSDQWGTPTYTEDLAAATVFLVERGLAGTYHAVGPEVIDRVRLARLVCERFGFDSRHVIPTPTRELRQAAPRPLRVILDCNKLRRVGVHPFRCLDEGLAALYAWHEGGLVAAAREPQGHEEPGRTGR